MPKKLGINFLLFLALFFSVNSISIKTVRAETAPSFVRNIYTEPTYDQFLEPLGVITNSNGIYVVDTGSNRIRKYDSSWNLLTNFGSSKLSYPRAAAYDSLGNIYATNINGDNVSKFDSNGNFLATIGSSGSGDGQFSTPTGIAIDKNDNIYVADYNNRIQKFDSSGSFVKKWGSYGSGDGQFSYPDGIAVDSSDNIYVTDVENSRIQKFSSNGVFITKWGSAGTGDGEFDYLDSIIIDKTNNWVYVADGGNYRIQKFDLNGGYLSQFGSEGSGDGEFYYPVGVSVDSSGKVYTVDSELNRVQVFDSSGAFLSKIGRYYKDDGQFDFPTGVHVDSLGNIYVSDYSNCRIQKFDSSGTFLSKFGSCGSSDGKFYGAASITLDSSGNIYVSDSENYRIQKFDSSGNFLAKWGSHGYGTGSYFGDWGAGELAYDPLGYVYATDPGNNVVRKFDTSGNYVSTIGPTYDSGTKTFNETYSVAVDSSSNVYITDTDNHRIAKFNSSGTFVRTIGSYGSGNGKLDHPQAVGADSSGNVYVGDSYNHRIEKFDTDGNFLSTWTDQTSGIGAISYPTAFGFGPLGNIYVADQSYYNISVFGSSTAPTAAVSVPSFTNSTSFNIGISLTDSLDTASYLQMKVSNSSDFSGSSWQSYITSLPWIISSSEGAKTIYFQFKNRNGNISSYQYNLTHDTLSPITDWKASDGTPVIFATHSVNGVFSDNIYTEETFPTFNFTKAGASGADIDRYQILLTKAGDNGYTDKVYIDSINPNKPGDSDLREDSNLWTKYNGYDISVRNKKDSDKLTTGAYKWRVRVIDKAGNVTDTSEKILRIGTHEAVFSKGYFPLSILHIGGQNLNISTLNLSAVPSELNIWTKVPTFYGIAIPETKVKLTLTDTQDKTNIFKKETTANGEAKFGINIEKKDNLSSGIYLASLNATGQNGDYTEIPDFKLNVNVGNSEPLVQGAFIEESPEPEVSPTPGPTKKPQPTIVPKLPSSKTCLLFWCW